MHSDREKLVKHMVDRFLRWRLPEDFNPDGGISFKPVFNEHTAHPMKAEPVGTNLFDAQQAEAMVRYMLDGAPALSEPVKDEPVAVKVDDTAWAKVRIDTEPDAHGFCFCTPYARHPDDVARDLPTEKWNESSQFYGQVTREPSPAGPVAADGTLREALNKIASWTQTEGLLWWQIEARQALALTRPAGERPAVAVEALREAVREALIFYENHGAGCRLVHSGGDASRNELAKDGGKRAGNALAAITTALGAQTPPEGAVTFYDQNNCPVCHGIPDYFGSLVDRARDAAAKASTKFPQPNYVTLKIAEEAGEVVRGAVHYAENRMEWKEVEGEIVQLLAMLIRFVTEGDQINGITPPVNQSEGADRG